MTADVVLTPMLLNKGSFCFGLNIICKNNLLNVFQKQKILLFL